MKHVRTALLICLVAFLLRMILVAQSPTIAYEGYDTVRQVEHIKETGLPLIKDELSYSGRTHTLLPVFPYTIAFSTIFLPDELAYLIVPNLLAVLLHAALYFLILELTNDRKLSTIGAIASIFLPTYTSSTLLTLSSLSLAIPLLVLMLTLFLKLRKTNEKRVLLLIVFLLLSLTNPIALLCIPLFIITLVLSTINKTRGEIAQKEFALFATLLLLWLYVILYKQSLISIGLETLRGNLPLALRQNTYENILFNELAIAVGIVPFGLALYAAYKEAAGKHIGIQATIALAITIALAMIVHVIPLQSGLVLLGIVAIALAAVGLQHIGLYTKSLKHTKLKKSIFITLAILFVFTSILQTFTEGYSSTQKTADKEVIKALEWIEENSLKGSLILSEPEWGALIEYKAKRPTYIDEDYIGIPDIEERYQNAQLILSGYNSASIAKQQRIDYIISQKELTDNCLNTVYKEEVYIMKVLCR